MSKTSGSGVVGALGLEFLWNRLVAGVKVPKFLGIRVSWSLGFLETWVLVEGMGGAFCESLERVPFFDSEYLTAENDGRDPRSPRSRGSWSLGFRGTWRLGFWFGIQVS